jgi:hypothetical protein
VADIIGALTDPVTAQVPGLSASADGRRVLQALVACRTARLGAHVQQCDKCEHRSVAYNSCRNRHCPKCQAASRERWFEARRQDLLPVGYFHVVFTLPAEISPLALQNKRVLYEILFRAASETLIQIAADPKHLGARIGFLCVLHTWGQTLVHHPHLHCIVPGGGLSLEGQRWIASRPNYFVPVKVLSPVFRGKFLDYLGQAYRSGQLTLTATLEHLNEPDRFAAFLRELRGKPWIVYCKPPMAGPEQVLKYLARYTHRVAIANSRLISLQQGRVAFRYKDYAQGDCERILELEALEFLRRFLLHVLPRGFQRIRHYGLLANCCRSNKVALCRTLIAQGGFGEQENGDPVPPQAPLASIRCPQCGVGVMVTVEIVRPGAIVLASFAPRLDSS